MTTSRYVLGWILATVLVTLAAWWVVAAASGGVSEQSVAPLVVPTSSTSLAPGSSTTDAGPGSTTNPGTSPTTSATVPSTTVPGGSSSTTAGSSGVEVISSAGGTVTVSYDNGIISLEGASPALGYTMEIEDTGPDKVRVDFESEGHDVSVRVEWDDGELEITIND